LKSVQKKTAPLTAVQKKHASALALFMTIFGSTRY